MEECAHILLRQGSIKTEGQSYLAHWYPCSYPTAGDTGIQFHSLLRGRKASYIGFFIGIYTLEQLQFTYSFSGQQALILKKMF